MVRLPDDELILVPFFLKRPLFAQRMKPSLQPLVFHLPRGAVVALFAVLILALSGCTSASSRYKKQANLIEQRYPYALTFPTPHAPKNNFNIILPNGERRHIVFSGDQIVRDEIR